MDILKIERSLFFSFSKQFITLNTTRKHSVNIICFKRKIQFVRIETLIMLSRTMFANPPTCGKIARTGTLLNDTAVLTL